MHNQANQQPIRAHFEHYIMTVNCMIALTTGLCAR